MGNETGPVISLDEAVLMRSRRLISNKDVQRKRWVLFGIVLIVFIAEKLDLVGVADCDQ